VLLNESCLVKVVFSGKSAISRSQEEASEEKKINSKWVELHLLAMSGLQNGGQFISPPPFFFLF
jgi:hypothetical protein